MASLIFPSPAYPPVSLLRIFVYRFYIPLFLLSLQNMNGSDNTYKIRPLFRKFTNKYTIAGLIFLVWIAFFDKNSIVEKMQLRSKISTLEKEKDYYQNKIEEDNRKIKELLSSPDNLEKFAREQYLMKKDNEDIFVIVNKP